MIRKTKSAKYVERKLKKKINLTIKDPDFCAIEICTLDRIPKICFEKILYRCNNNIDILCETKVISMFFLCILICKTILNS